MDIDATVSSCERLFAPWLDGHPLLSNTPPSLREAPWLRFARVTNRHWSHGSIVLAGDAAHTAHFSIGSGTKLAMEDAIALARILNEGGTLQAYEDERRTEAMRLQNAARNSMEWFENVRRYMALEPEQFAYSLLTRSQRVSHENLRLRDRAFVARSEAWFAEQASAGRPQSTGAVSSIGASMARSEPPHA